MNFISKCISETWVGQMYRRISIPHVWLQQCVSGLVIPHVWRVVSCGGRNTCG